MIEKLLEEARWKSEGQNGAATQPGTASGTLREWFKKYGISRS